VDLPDPWWAMLTVFLAQPTQPLVGAIWAKAFYGVVGTLIGATAGIAGRHAPRSEWNAVVDAIGADRHRQHPISRRSKANTM
jgi:hypothetical protein